MATNEEILKSMNIITHKCYLDALQKAREDEQRNCYFRLEEGAAEKVKQMVARIAKLEKELEDVKGVSITIEQEPLKDREKMRIEGELMRFEYGLSLPEGRYYHEDDVRAAVEWLVKEMKYMGGDAYGAKDIKKKIQEGFPDLFPEKEAD